MSGARVLTSQDRFQCPHGGAVVALTATTFSVDGHLALVTSGGAVLRVEGCAHEPPCDAAVIDAPDSPLTEHGLSVLLATARGTSYADGQPAGELVLVPGDDSGVGASISLL